MEHPESGGEWGIKGYPSEEQSGDKLSWILNKGLSVGKKMLVTGFVISSVSLVLPPLVVISVIGLACSVPSGIFLANYVVTDTLMSKLLPGSKPPRFLLGYGEVSTDEELENEEGDYYGGLKGEIDMEKEEENGDFYQYKREMQEEPVIEIEVTTEGARKEEAKEPVLEERLNQPTVDEVNIVFVKEEETPGIEVEKIVVQLGQNAAMEEDQEIVKETRGLLEKIRDEGSTDTLEGDKQRLEKLPADAEEGDQKGNRNDYSNIRTDKPQRVTEHKVEEDTNNKISKESSKMKGTGQAENVETMPEKKRPKVEKPALSHGGRANNDVANKSSLEREKETVISTNEGAREISDESGFELYDRRHGVEGNGKSSSYASIGTTDNNELPVSAREKESNSLAGISSGKELGMASSKVLYSEKKMWQQIDAMRKIVGYKVAKQPTCFEELKALYLFTGVKPPASFKDPSDLQEMNDKLLFLMSIVGVKQQ